jgi:hypothetical protein
MIFVSVLDVANLAGGRLAFTLLQGKKACSIVGFGIVVRSGRAATERQKHESRQVILLVA